MSKDVKEKAIIVWTDFGGIAHNIAYFYSDSEYYYITINEEEMDKAKEKGCIGFIDIDDTIKNHKSKELFPFLVDRVSFAPRNKEGSLEETTWIKRLKQTKGELATDLYSIHFV